VAEASQIWTSVCLLTTFIDIYDPINGNLPCSMIMLLMALNNLISNEAKNYQLFNYERSKHKSR